MTDVAATTTGGDSGTKRPFKQAVVIVHGIGQQRPLETIREFAETVYQRDTTLTEDIERHRDVAEDGGPINRVWIVPDTATGSTELKRITTSGGKTGRRTDFYEFYWADITEGTPTQLVWAWLRYILFRSPRNVPLRVQTWLAWLLLWLLAIVIVLAALILADPASGPFGVWVAWLAETIAWNRGMIAKIFVLLAAGLHAVRVFTARKGAVVSFRPSLILLIAAAAVYVTDAPFFANARFWAGAIMALAAGLTASLIVPYVGDVVRYVRATPSTIKQRAEVRERGLKLLRELHDKGLWRDSKGKLQGSRVYDRIVVVGHSLGTIIAYDLLQLFWEERGPNPLRGETPSKAVQDACDEIDVFVKAVAEENRAAAASKRKPRYAFDLGAYRQKQFALYEVLAAEKGGWIISDFITLGSPIVHAEFLTADSRDHLQRSLRERMVSASPPVPDLPRLSMMYKNDKRNAFYPHHGAVFAPTRWTNIYDEHWLPLMGDIVSGKFPEDLFGPGIDQQEVTIKRGPLPVFNRFCTHTLYWRNMSGKWDAPSDHIIKLRKALDL